MQPLENHQPCREANGEGGENDMERHRKGELHPREQEREGGGTHRQIRSSAAAAGSRPSDALATVFMMPAFRKGDASASPAATEGAACHCSGSARLRRSDTSASSPS